MMAILRICSMSILLGGIWTSMLPAQETARETVQAPSSELIIALDHETANLFRPRRVLGVLIASGQESPETIEARALALRHATHFVYRSGPTSTLGAMYRERLQSQGLIAIELPRPVKRPHDVSQRGALVQQRPSPPSSLLASRNAD